MTTPEERAAAIEIVREIAKESPADGLLLAHSIAAAIRAAVAEERERAARVAEEMVVDEDQKTEEAEITYRAGQFDSEFESIYSEAVGRHKGRASAATEIARRIREQE